MNPVVLLRRAWARPGVRFAFVGALNAALNLAGLWALVDGLHVPWPAAVAVLFVALNVVGYRMNKALTFRLGRAVVTPELARYFAVMATTLAANLALMALLVDRLHLAYLLASAVVTVLLAVVNYVAHRDLTFGRPAAPAGEAKSATLRVLQVSAFFGAHGGGIEAVAGQLAVRLAARGVALTWMAGGRPEEKPSGDAPGSLAVDQAGSADFVERRLGLPAPLWNLAAVRRLWRHVGACQLVHVHDYLYLPSLLALAFARLRRRPVLLTQHIGDIAFESRAARRVLHTLNRTLGRLSLGTCDQVVFVGRPVLQTFDAFVSWRRPPRLVPNGVDAQLYHPGEEPRMAASSVTPLRALFVGRFVEKKGLGLLRACLDLPGIHWTFVGRGPLAPAEASTASIRLAGALAPPEVAREMQAADVLVLPSKGEGFPLVVQEALACGTPVLVSGEVADAFTHTDAGCVWPVDVDAAGPGAADGAAQRLRARLAQLRDDPGELQAARPRAVALAAQWSWTRCIDEYVQLYRDILR